MMQILYVMIALLFIVSPILAGVFVTLWYLRKKEIDKVRKSLEELRIENRKLLYGMYREETSPQNERQSVTDKGEAQAKPGRKRNRRKYRYKVVKSDAEKEKITA